MSDDLELNISAAELLKRPSSLAYGKTSYNVFDGWWPSDGLKFTTSFDWAMLLVKECIKRDGPPYSNTYLKLFGHTILRSNEPIGAWYDWMISTPAQITKAAVEVLEGRDE